MQRVCAVCGKEISHDESALNQKLQGRGVEAQLCLSCLAKRFDADEEYLRELIEYFKAKGCGLFR